MSYLVDDVDEGGDALEAPAQVQHVAGLEEDREDRQVVLGVGHAAQAEGDLEQREEEAQDEQELGRIQLQRVHEQLGALQVELVAGEGQVAGRVDPHQGFDRPQALCHISAFNLGC